MNKFVTTALALVAAGSVGFADPGDNEWLELDSEIESLASALTPAQDGMGWTVLLRISYTFSDDDIATGGGDDISGFKFEDADLAFWGAVAEYGWRISFDIEEAGIYDDDDLQFEDAYVFWDCGEYLTTTFGQFKPNTLRSGSIDPENQLFIDRTALGSTFDWWDVGIGAEGYYEAFSWWASLINEGTGTGNQDSDHYYSVRVEYNFGAGAGAADGAMGGNDELNFTVGVAYVKQDASIATGADDTILAGDVAGNFGSFGFAGEIASLDDDSIRLVHEDFSRLNDPFEMAFSGDSTPWSITLSYLITPEWEAGVRYESLDNDDDFLGISGVDGPDNTIVSIAVVWYRSGKNAKWTAQWSDIDADTSGFDDGTVWQVGLTVGATR